MTDVITVPTAFKDGRECILIQKTKGVGGLHNKNMFGCVCKGGGGLNLSKQIAIEKQTWRYSKYFMRIEMVVL